MLRGLGQRCLPGLLTLLAHPLMASGSADVVGEAYDLQRGDLLYSELHYCDQSGKSCRIVYQDQDGLPIARKIVDYSNNALAPALQFSDIRSSQEFSLDLSRNKGLVVDAGFDNFIRSRWNDLTGGALVGFQFQVVGRDKPLEMIARNQLEAGCEAGELCLEVAVDSWLLSLLTRPIRLTYDRESRRLLRYRGISNIRDDDGGSQQVEIVYHYWSTNDE